jgi:hypothetical protein
MMMRGIFQRQVHGNYESAERVIRRRKRFLSGFGFGYGHGFGQKRNERSWWVEVYASDNCPLLQNTSF